jgi:hypothetical protein
MPLIDDYLLDNYTLDGISYRLSQYYRPVAGIKLNLPVPSSSVSLSVAVASPAAITKSLESPIPEESVTATI